MTTMKMSKIVLFAIFKMSFDGSFKHPMALLISYKGHTLHFKHQVSQIADVNFLTHDILWLVGNIIL